MAVWGEAADLPGMVILEDDETDDESARSAIRPMGGRRAGHNYVRSRRLSRHVYNE